MGRKDLSMAFVGSGGDGVVTVGDMIAHGAAAEGLNVIKTEAYGPQIRGGESSCTVRVSSEPLYTPSDRVDAMVVFKWSDLERFKSEILVADDAVVFHEENDEVPAQYRDKPGIHLIPVAIQERAKNAGAPSSKNIFMIGAFVGLFGLPADATRNAVSRKFEKRGDDLLQRVLAAFDAGFAWAVDESSEELGALCDERRLEYVPGKPKLLMSGNEAAAVGALHAGCRFYAGYPITPSSEILQYLAEWLPRLGGTFIQTEDEIAAIGAVIGASFAGVKAFTATSGPGLSLMSEMIGLSTISEIPAVIIDVQRGGPSTGLPTRTEQSDLWHALYGGHGDAPRVVLATSDVEDCFHTMVDAFNIAEEFQLPVIVLSDQSIGQRKETINAETLQHEVRERTTPTPEDLENYQRYRDTPNGVSPMSVPGMPGGMYQTNGLEHDRYGNPSSSFEVHEEMNEKRYRKLRPIRERYHHVRRYGHSDARIGIVCWGSSKGPVKEAVLKANERGESVKAFVPQVLFPFPKKEYEEFVEGIDQLVVIELSYAAQFYKYLRTFRDLPHDQVLLYKRSGGVSLSVAEVDEVIQKALDRVSQKSEVVA